MGNSADLGTENPKIKQVRLGGWCDGFSPSHSENIYITEKILNGSNSNRPRLQKHEYDNRKIKGLGTNLNEVIRDHKRLKIDIAVLTETNIIEQGSTDLQEFIRFYSKVNKYKRAATSVRITYLLLGSSLVL